MNGILEMKGCDPYSVPVELMEDTMHLSLFTTTTAPPLAPYERDKRHHSFCTSEGVDARARKKEQTELEAARRVSLLDE